MIARAVIGASFGDEGKGLVTDWLCSKGAGIVVRFNGGCNAGHTVVTPQQERHVFKHFGSGSLCDIPTYLSSFFVCNPILFFQEFEELKILGFRPEVYAHPDCLVTTYADMVINQAKEFSRGGKRHGSCGIGLHETMNRSKIKELSITMNDLWNGTRSSLESKMAEICDKYAKFRIGETIEEPRAIAAFLDACAAFAQYVNPLGMQQCKDPVFEGAQGLLLDQDNKEFFPHLTHSKTGMHNVGLLCEQSGIKDLEIYYVSRTYLTRHGAGQLPGEDSEMEFEDDTNAPNPFQGRIRFAPLNCDALKDRCYEDAGTWPMKFVLTHCDQLAPPLEADLYCYGPNRTEVKTHQLETVSK